ncbi:MFS transporter [Pseudonocardia adelaidensis]|uniref:MFS transporter n=1 Tax=Pseudonocardia adelaidensis TaxID=648754 RepID=A0ABP9NG40_9PSEU
MRRHRIAATLLFTVDGAVFGSWASRIPDVAAGVGAGPTTLGLALLCVSLGALASMQLTGVLCARLGPGLTGVAAAIATCAAIALPGLTGSVPALAAALLGFGAATGTLNVAANAIGVQVEAALHRPVLPSLHAGFSAGGLGGATAGGAVAAVASPAVHLLVVAALGALVTAAVAPALLAADGEHSPDGADPAPRGTARGIVVVLGVIAGCTAFGEGAVTDWGALHLQEIGATPVLAAAGYSGFSLAMACGRLAGNGLVHAAGPTRVVTGGALLATTGALVVATVPAVPIVLAGFVLIGLGLANVFPIAIARAGAHAGAGGVALASTVGYTGLLGGPPLLGIVAEAVGLPVAFATVAALAAVAAGLAVPALGGGERVLHAVSTALRAAVARHTSQLGVLHTQLSGPAADRRPYPGLEALAT